MAELERGLVLSVFWRRPNITPVCQSLFSACHPLILETHSLSGASTRSRSPPAMAGTVMTVRWCSQSGCSEMWAIKLYARQVGVDPYERSVSITPAALIISSTMAVLAGQP